jgi:uncharacterized membrane protein
VVTIDTQADGCRIVAQPNCSASWHGNKLLLAALAGWSALAALFFTALGLWLIIPFLGLELAAVAAGLYTACWKLQRRHVLRIADGALVLEKGHYNPRFTWRFPRDAASLSVEVPHHPWDPLKIFLCSPGEQVPIGDFLSKEDSRELLALLRAQGLRVRNYSELMRVDL